MKRYFYFSFILFLLVTFDASARAKGSRSGTQLSMPPVVIQAVGAGEVNLIPAKFPIFKNYSRYKSKERGCVTVCEAKNKEGSFMTVEQQFRLYGTAATQGMADNGGYIKMMEKEINFNNIGNKYQKNANIFVTWTVRIVGEARFLDMYKPLGASHPRVKSGEVPLRYHTGVCSTLGAWSNWHGYVYQEFTGGEARTRLMVNGTQRGNEAIMSIPFKGGSGVYTPSDPTITGSALLKAEDFGGEFPDVLNFEVQWQNDTSLHLTSPLDADGNTTRNLIITIMPVK